MFIFLSTLVVCATIIVLAFKQPVIKIELSQKPHEFKPEYTEIPEEEHPETDNGMDALEAIMGDMVTLFTGGDRVDEDNNTTR